MIDDLEQEILNRGLDDIIQLSEIVSVAREDLNVQEGDKLFAVVFRCLASLVGRGWAIVGDLDDAEPPLAVVPWSGSSDEVAERAISEWRALGRLPDLGEICWLELTDSGSAAARRAGLGS